MIGQCNAEPISVEIAAYMRCRLHITSLRYTICGRGPDSLDRVLLCLQCGRSRFSKLGSAYMTGKAVKLKHAHLGSKVIGRILGRFVYVVSYVHISSLQLRQSPQDLQHAVHVATVAQILEANVPAKHGVMLSEVCFLPLALACTGKQRMAVRKAQTHADVLQMLISVTGSAQCGKST